MVFGRYKKTNIYLCIDEATKKWSAWNIKDYLHSVEYDTVDALRDALRLGTIEWKEVRI